MIDNTALLLSATLLLAVVASPAGAVTLPSSEPLIFCADSCIGAPADTSPASSMSAPEDGLGWMHDVTPDMIEWPGGAAAVAASAPEPAGWALLIAGFATVGAATRRRLKDAAS